MKRRVAKLLPLYVAVCLLTLIASTPTLAQRRSTSSAKTTTASKNKVPTTSTTSAKTGTATAATKPANSANSGFMSQLEKEIIDEMNLARAEPQTYATFVEEYKKYYDGNRLTIPGRKKSLVTAEGVAAVDEAINFLRNQKSLPPLAAAKGLCQAAKDHAHDLATKGLSGHRGSDGSMPDARVERYGNWEGTIGETVVYEVNTARFLVIALIIDDGTPTRGHRRNIFDPSYKVAGVSIAETPGSGAATCVVDYVGGFRDKSGAGN
ncbi:MAG TPA: CAP domain-containing protein [Pyrinomonadaceae bacterium]|nr:CAP domain-containing protein [Pyrinomonadaceae bacterium]